MSVRVRMAPSPTGHLHVGNARTALFNYLYAKNKGGTYIVRIEDTDMERSTSESEDLMLKDFEWLGLPYDEGPEKDSGYGPYRQSQRLHIYEEYTDKLLKIGKAYRCYCTKEELDLAREEAKRQNVAYRYDGKCRNLNDTQQTNKPFAIRFRTTGENILVKDVVKGNVSFNSDAFGDFVIVRPDGTPIYNYVCAIDDHLMKITHVIRGDDHLSNTPKQVMVYNALGIEAPIFAHIPMILGSDHSKLSKRHGETSINEFRIKGYLPEAMVNYMSLLSWSDEGEREIMTVDELVQSFSLERVSKSAAVFDFGKLNWMNGIYIRNMDEDRYAALCKEYITSSGLMSASDIESDYEHYKKIVLSVRGNLDVLSDISKHIDVYFVYDLHLDNEYFKADSAKNILQHLLDAIPDAKYIPATDYASIIKGVQKSSGAKGKALYMTIRLGITGKTEGPEMEHLMTLISTSTLKNRISKALESL